MSEFKRATAEDAAVLRELLAEFPSLDSINSDNDCRSALGHATGMVNALVSQEDMPEGSRLWMDVPGAMDVLQATDTYLRGLWGECMSRQLTNEVEQVEQLLDRTQGRLQRAAETDRRYREVVGQHLESGAVIVPHRKTRQTIQRILNPGE